VQLFATGAGSIPNAPPDGTPASGLTHTPAPPRVIFNGRDTEVQYSGLAPGLLGVWQLNVRVPDAAPPGNNLVVVLMYEIPSNDNRPNQIRATVAVQR
jgi:uncharacterized protein (TIGR03437 family)